jgi:hypothetical protein
MDARYFNIVTAFAAGVALFVFVVLVVFLGRTWQRFVAVREATVRPPASAEYWSTLLKDYYTHALPQAAAAYWCGLIMVLGAAMITAFITSRSVWPRNAPLYDLYSAATVGLVGVLLLWLSNQSRKLMLAVIEGVREDRKHQEALQLVSSITDPDTRRRLQVVLALHWSGVRPARPDLTIVDTVIRRPPHLQVWYPRGRRIQRVRC